MSVASSSARRRRKAGASSLGSSQDFGGLSDAAGKDDDIDLDEVDDFSEVLENEAATLRTIHAACAVFFLAEALVFFFLGQDHRVMLTIMTPVAKAADTELVSVPFVEVSVNVLVGLYLVVAAMHHLVVQVPRFNRQYLKYVAQGRAPFRWAEYCSSAAIMVVILAILLGITDVMVLGLQATLMAATNWFGAVAEKDKSSIIQGNYWLPHMWGWVTCVMSFVPIAVGLFLGTRPMGAAEHYAYVLTPAMMAAFSLFGALQVAQLADFLGQHGSLRAEYAFSVLSLLTKSLMAALVFVGNVLM